MAYCGLGEHNTWHVFAIHSLGNPLPYLPRSSPQVRQTGRGYHYSSYRPKQKAPEGEVADQGHTEAVAELRQVSWTQSLYTVQQPKSKDCTEGKQSAAERKVSGDVP